MSFGNRDNLKRAAQDLGIDMMDVEFEEDGPLDEGIAKIALTNEDGGGGGGLASELTEADYDEIDPDGELRRNGKLKEIPLGTLVDLCNHIMGVGNVQEQASSTLPRMKQQVRAIILPKIEKYEFGPFERLVQAKQCYLLETAIEKELAILRAKNSGCQSDAQIADFLRTDEGYNKDIAEARKRCDALLKDYCYLNLGERIFRKNLTPAQVAGASSNEGIKCAVTANNPKLLKEVAQQAGWISCFRNRKAQIAAGLATYGHYEGQQLENSPIVGLYLPQNDHAIRIASVMVESMYNKNGMLIDQEVEYDRLRRAGIKAMKYYLDGKTEWHSLLAAYYPEEARIIIDHILIKLMEKEVIAARMITSEEGRRAINRVYISLTPPYLPKKQKVETPVKLLPEPFTGSFLLK